MKFYFVRHGQSEANAARLIADDTPKLTELGRQQAVETAKKLADKNISKILCSPLVRAKETAEIIATELGMNESDIKVLLDLRERRVGECEGKPKDMESEMYITLDTERGFESQAALIERLLRALEDIKDTIKKTDGAVIVVGHVTAGYYLMQLAKGYRKLAEFEAYFHTPNAGYAEVEIVSR
jgi:uncharacterized phosphatase